MIYCGPTGHNSQQLVEFFQSLEGVPRVQEGVNPATWMLEVTRPAEERRLGIDFAQVYQDSDLFRCILTSHLAHTAQLLQPHRGLGLVPRASMGLGGREGGGWGGGSSHLGLQKARSDLAYV